jgi:flavin-dependent dehydrogenase
VAGDGTVVTKSQPTVAVLGAGPAGAIAALQLARAGLSVQIIGRRLQRRPRIAETLSPEGRSELAVAGLWDRLPRGVAVPCPVVVSAWERAEPTWRSFITNPYGCAWHVDRGRFDTWLVSEAEAAGAVLVTAAVTGIRRTDCHWAFDVRRADGEGCAAKADFLVVATGRCGFAASLGGRERIDALCLIGGLSEPMTDAGDSLLVEAVPDGWWYSAPTTDGRMFAGWMTDATLTADKRCREAMSTALAHAPLTRARLANPPEACCVGVASLAMTPCAGEGWIAVGDAALARDPISGEGLACAVRSAREGAGTILNALGGDSSAWHAASIRGAAAVAQYRNQKAVAYKAAQHRWPAERFWARRLS